VNVNSSTSVFSDRRFSRSERGNLMQKLAVRATILTWMRFGPKEVSKVEKEEFMRKTMFAVAAALALGTATLATPLMTTDAMARGGGWGGGGGGHWGGGGAHWGGGGWGGGGHWAGGGGWGGRPGFAFRGRPGFGGFGGLYAYGGYPYYGYCGGYGAYPYYYGYRGCGPYFYGW
jgi:hypothetical protein